jgi:hypothetical protein
MEMIYGWCLPRTLHYKVTLRARHPEMRILMRKYDYSDAYRRIAHSAEAATQTIAANGNTAYLSLRLMFGGLPNPPTWCNSGQWQYGLPVPQTDVRGTAQPTNLVHVLRVGDVFGQQDWAVCQRGTSWHPLTRQRVDCANNCYLPSTLMRHKHLSINMLLLLQLHLMEETHWLPPITNSS